MVLDPLYISNRVFSVFYSPKRRWKCFFHSSLPSADRKMCTIDFVGPNIKPVFISDRACECMAIVEGSFAQWSAAVGVEGVWGSSEFVLGTHSHFISSGATGLPDHHTSVTAHSVLSAAAQTCQLHLCSWIPRRVSPAGLSEPPPRRADTCLLLLYGFDGLLPGIVRQSWGRSGDSLYWPGPAVKINAGVSPEWIILFVPSPPP